ncbi:hypothetical protein [Thalassospira sp.]|uniref:hypothetical protein n=1 Tax=Thalassospira sp. TaxID=1912094 RepID=UPI0025E10302|nr:hypothetical protein [Thalassospira sp.]
MSEQLKISREALREIEAAYQKYEREVESLPLASSTKTTYLSHSQNFVRWLSGDFIPGSTKTGVKP